MGDLSGHEATRDGERGDAMDFDVEDIRPAREAQVVKGMFYDRRTFLVVNTGDSRPIAIALMPHQAVALGKDLIAATPTGEVRRQRVEPIAMPAPVRMTRDRSQKVRITRAVQMIPKHKESGDPGTNPPETAR